MKRASCRSPRLRTKHRVAQASAAADGNRLISKPTLNSEKAFRILIWCFGVVLFVFALVPLMHYLRGHSIKDYITWYQTGQLVLQRREVYPEILVQKFDFMYPPPCALFLARLAGSGNSV